MLKVCDLDGAMHTGGVVVILPVSCYSVNYEPYSFIIIQIVVLDSQSKVLLCIFMCMRLR